MKKTLIFAALAAVLASCSSEQITSPISQGDVKLALNGSVVGTVNVNTKADPINLSENTNVGVYAWQTSDMPTGSVTTLATTQLANASYTVNNAGAFSSFSYLQLFKERTYKAAAYAPFKLTGFSSGTTSITFNHGDDVLYAPAADVVFKTDVSPITASVALSFAHKMSQIKLTLVSGDGNPSLDNVTVKISGFYNSCSMDLTDGTLTPNAEKTAIINQVQKKTDPDQSILTPFCIVPGNIIMTIEITTEGVNYKKVFEEKTFSASQSNEFVLKLNKTKTSLDVTGKVVNWTPVDVTNIDVPSI